MFGWFQGRCEFGPRALGNRSILGDPRRAEMKDILNKRVKFRQAFRPFAPIVPYERAKDIFVGEDELPFMLRAKKFAGNGGTAFRRLSMSTAPPACKRSGGRTMNGFTIC